MGCDYSTQGICNVHGSGKVERVPIFYGSRTGTSQYFSNQLSEEALKHGLRTKVVDLQYYKSHFTPTPCSSVVIFVLTTYGHGDPTYNAQEFFEFITHLEGTPFAKTYFALFGVGDTRFGDRFNIASNHLKEHLERLGATMIGEFGKGDSKSRILLDKQFEEWQADLWNKLLKKSPSSAKLARGSWFGGEPEIDVQDLAVDRGTSDFFETSSETRDVVNVIQESDSSVGQYYFHSQRVDIIKSEVVCPALGSVLISMSVPQDYDIEDVLAATIDVLPENNPDEVARFAKIFNLKLQNYIMFTAETAPFPSPCTVETALTKYCDITSMPHRLLAKEVIYSQTAEDSPKRKLVEPESYDQLCEAQVSFVDFAEEFMDGFELPLETFFRKCPRLHPRTYVACSTFLDDDERIQIYVNRTQQELPPCPVMSKLGEGRVREGVCSSWLCKREPKSMNITISPSNFRLPSDPTTPVIFVCTGAAVAPFRSFILHFLKIPIFDRPSTCILFLGCRDHESTPFDEEFEKIKELWEGFQYFPALSRLGIEKVYVQHRIRQHQLMVAQVVNDNGSIYVCGGIDMARDVRSAFEEIFTIQFTNATFANLEAEGRYVEDLWI